MNFIRNYFLSFILLLAISLWAYKYYEIATPCKRTILYSLGNFDTRFGISKAAFLEAIGEAEGIWEKTMTAKSLGNDLFEFDQSKGDLKINLIYDDRQRMAEERRELISRVDETKESADTIKAQFSELESRYKKYEAEYNSLINQYNQKPNNNLRKTILQKQTELNSLGDQINKLVDKYNFLVKTINSNVDVINQGAGEEFEEGRYIYDENGERINIYEFGSKDALVKVLTHEFGHALGLDHNNNPDSIMYYLNTDTNIVPTIDDLQALKVACRLK